MEDGKRKKVSKFTGQYTAAEAASYATCALLQTVTEYTRVDISEMEKDPTELVELAQESQWYQKYRGGPPREIGEPVGPDTSTRATRGSASGSRRHRLGRRRKAGMWAATSRDGPGAISYGSQGRRTISSLAHHAR